MIRVALINDHAATTTRIHLGCSLNTDDKMEVISSTHSSCRDYALVVIQLDEIKILAIVGPTEHARTWLKGVIPIKNLIRVLNCWHCSSGVIPVETTLLQHLHTERTRIDLRASIDCK
jgi:hypothetical protein